MYCMYISLNTSGELKEQLFASQIDASFSVNIHWLMSDNYFDQWVH